MPLLVRRRERGVRIVDLRNQLSWRLVSLSSPDAAKMLIYIIVIFLRHLFRSQADVNGFSYEAKFTFDWPAGAELLLGYALPVA